MTCRAPTSAPTCAGGQPTGQQMSYDTEGRLSAWQNAPSNPSSTVIYLYDGEGHRVEQQTTQSGTTTTTVYVGNLEEVTTTGSTTTTTTYYGKLALAVNGVLSYLVSDELGSISEALDTSGNVQASQLFGPYGQVRYSSGTMPGSYGFTGQHTDSSTGLDYFNARYYDPAAGTFTSADTVLAGLNRYGYVAGNPETLTDPSGHRPADPPPAPDPLCLAVPWLCAAVIVATGIWAVCQVVECFPAGQETCQVNCPKPEPVPTPTPTPTPTPPPVLDLNGNTQFWQDIWSLKGREWWSSHDRHNQAPDQTVQDQLIDPTQQQPEPGTDLGGRRVNPLNPPPEAEALPDRTKDRSLGNKQGDPTECVLEAGGQTIHLKVEAAGQVITHLQVRVDFGTTEARLRPTIIAKLTQ
jgi:RHS repeat-associated protein